MCCTEAWAQRVQSGNAAVSANDFVEKRGDTSRASEEMARLIGQSTSKRTKAYSPGGKGVAKHSPDGIGPEIQGLSGEVSGGADVLAEAPAAHAASGSKSPEGGAPADGAHLLPRKVERRQP